MSKRQTQPSSSDAQYKNISFMECLRIQKRVIGALILREILTRYGRHNIGFLWLFIEPMLFSVGIAVLWTYAGVSHKGISVAGFALTGYSALVMWRNTVNRLTHAVSSNRGLLYHRKVTILDLVCARLIVELAGVTASLVVLTIVFYRLGLMTFPEDPLCAFVGWLSLMWFVAGAGLIATYLGEISPVFDRIWHVLLYLTTPFTGTFAMLNWFNPDVQKILLWSPMVHAVEIFREGYFGTKIGAIYSLEYVVLVNTSVSLIGLLLLNKVKDNLEDV